MLAYTKSASYVWFGANRQQLVKSKAIVESTADELQMSNCLIKYVQLECFMVHGAILSCGMWNNSTPFLLILKIFKGRKCDEKKQEFEIKFDMSMFKQP